MTIKPRIYHHYTELTAPEELAVNACMQLTGPEAQAYHAATDKLLWIEHNILDVLELPGVTTATGEQVANTCEDWFEGNTWWIK